MKRLALLCVLALLSGRGLAGGIEAVTEETAYSYYQAGEAAGPLSELTREVLDHAGLPYRLEIYPWARAYDLAQAQANVLIFPLLRTPEREAQFKWVGEIGEIHSMFYRLAGRPDITLAHWQDAQQYTVGVVRDDFREVFLRNQGFTRLVVSASAQDNVRKLLNGQVDLVPLADVDAARYQGTAQAPFVALAPIGALTVHAWYAYSLQTSDTVVQRTRQAFNAVTHAP